MRQFNLLLVFCLIALTALPVFSFPNGLTMDSIDMEPMGAFDENGAADESPRVKRYGGWGGRGGWGRGGGRGYGGRGGGWGGRGGGWGRGGGGRGFYGGGRRGWGK
ncbi:YGGWG-amide [Caenorhabditis elegans]|uniref:Neuropeptide-like protein 32 n=1 Tax=Caenorhabditis elegans TaxID=6239 RepID=NLP32_CAEEL|nr:YGGWG-amide [Caenorhabditis elegans]Q09982.1 RecName: Full=Neuropeptide-like protein 32; Contains: RecName: Full=YGGWG-amide; Contains: RecName: Full=GGW-amide; Contains: RecName: Full=GG-amide; Contains: RecName: Full=GYG-amide; Contains: RecName: Full=GGGWG-amide; Contains: RecName: Full=GGGW-amide; Contains: RecName: Full=GGG-amide; Contains: RecName: Full=GFYGG-amide; Contains: RecName: Full=GW-amide; Flags: Precursor [Caenorhabditis elegans]CCD69154.1 YGGWG-amide [Caenorhabditis elegans]|eukprot:NP_497204.1 YGGWG-amide [Caenorhabditis elegans]